MTYYSTKDIKSQSKIGLYLFACEFFFLIIFGVIVYMMASNVNSNLRILYYIFSGVVGIGLTIPSPYNKQRRMYQSIIIYLKKDNNVYHAVRSDYLEVNDDTIN